MPSFFAFFEVGGHGRLTSKIRLHSGHDNGRSWQKTRLPRRQVHPCALAARSCEPSDYLAASVNFLFTAWFLRPIIANHVNWVPPGFFQLSAHAPCMRELLKGRPLTQSDLIRNYFFMRIHIEEQEKVYADYWKPMHDGLGDNLTEYIRHFLMRGGTNVKQSDVYISLKDLVSQEDAVYHLKELSRFASNYQKLLYPENENNLEVRKALERINRIEVTTAYPFLLNCYND